MDDVRAILEVIQLNQLNQSRILANQSRLIARLEAVEYAQMTTTLDIEIHQNDIKEVLYDRDVKIQALRVPQLHPAGQRAMRINGLVEATLITATCSLCLHESEAAALCWLLRAQSTCKQLKAMIDHSPTLQQMLFTPQPLCGKVRVDPLLDVTALNRILNLGVSAHNQLTLLLIHQFLAISHHRQEATHLRVIERTFSGASHRLTFALTEACASTNSSRWSSRCRKCKAKMDSEEAEGSWRKMFISQPPFRVYFEVEANVWNEGRLWKVV